MHIRCARDSPSPRMKDTAGRLPAEWPAPAAATSAPAANGAAIIMVRRQLVTQLFKRLNKSVPITLIRGHSDGARRCRHKGYKALEARNGAWPSCTPKPLIRFLYLQL